MAKRILIFCGGHMVSGAEIITLNILSELKIRGYQLHCICSAWSNGDFQNRLKELDIAFTNVKLGFIYLSKPLWTLDTLINYPKALFKIRKIAAAFKPSITYHVNYRTVFTTWFLFGQKPLYLHIHDPYLGKTAELYLKFLNRKVFRYIAVSDYIQQNLISSGAVKDKIVVIKNGLKPAIKQPAPIPEVIRIGIIGQVLERKGHEVLIDAVALLKKELNNFKLIIIGHVEEDYFLHLKNKIDFLKLNQVIEWKGYMRSQDTIYSFVDLVVVPSKTPDPFPTSALEAGLYGKACVVSNMGGLPEIIKNEITGYVIPADDPAILAEKLKNLIKNPDKIKQMSKEAQAYITTEFTLEKQIFKLINVFENA